MQEIIRESFDGESNGILSSGTSSFRSVRIIRGFNPTSYMSLITVSEVAIFE